VSSSSPRPNGPSGVPADLAYAQAEFLARAAAADDRGSEFTVVPTETDPGGATRGWRFDLNVGLSGRSFLLTTDGRWCSAVRTGTASFGWGVFAGTDLAEALEAWSEELIRRLRSAPLGE
jgi:hypothetical protein